jgi:hypothetical protein
MHNHPFGNGTVNLFPRNHSTQTPFVWLACLDEGPRFAGPLELSLTHRTEREAVDGSSAFLELSCRREVPTAQPVVPWLMALKEAVCRRVAGGPLVAEQPPVSKLFPADRPASFDIVSVARNDLKGGTTDGTGERNAVPFHSGSIAKPAMQTNGAGTS